jgi:hypothetical protein
MKITLVFVPDTYDALWSLIQNFLGTKAFDTFSITKLTVIKNISSICLLGR